jgi:UDP-N-acetylmuramoyl-tripeptide--D-alanyl-D-alanine ligase
MAARWGEITVREVASAMGGRIVSGPPDAPLSGLSTDSRTLTPGQVFLALRGERYDGHDFLSDAVNGGAAGVIVETLTSVPLEVSAQNLAVITVKSTLDALGDLALWWRKHWPGRVIAITGSNGKSTTKEMAASILFLEANIKKSPGNYNNLIGLPLTILSLKGVHQAAVLEMGMNRPGEIRRLAQIADPHIGLITNIAQAHLEGLGNLQGVVEAKAELLEMMSSHATAILNGDDQQYPELASRFSGRTITFGLGHTNAVRAENIRKVDDNAQAFDICLPEERIPVRIRLPGIHNVLNALGAAAIAYGLSLSKGSIARGLEQFVPLKGRFQVTRLNGDIRIIDDTYNANPSSLGAALNTVQELRSEKQGLVVGLGEMLELGTQAPQLHRDAGRLIAETGTRYLVALGEHGAEIVKGACKGGMDSGQTHLATSHGEMIDVLKAQVREHDIVFLKGSRRAFLDKVVEGIKDFLGINEESSDAV